jgi:hypothetical protein
VVTGLAKLGCSVNVIAKTDAATTVATLIN